MATAHLSAFLRRLTRGMVAETLADQSDQQLVEQLLVRRDEAVFEALVRRHGPMVYRVCWRVLMQPQDAEDAFQATFLLLAQKLRTLRKHDSLASWLHGIARRVALKARAQAAVRRRHEQQAGALPAASSDEINWRELRTLLDAELARLPEKWRLPLILCYLEERTQDEAAAQLGWSRTTLQRRLAAARAALSRRLKQRGAVWPAALSAVLLADCATSAALPLALVGSTVEAAAGPAAAGVISVKVVALTEGVRKAMLLAKLRVATAILLAFGVIGAGAATLCLGYLRTEPQQPRQDRTSLQEKGSVGSPLLEGALVMDNPKALDPLFREAASAIDAGDVTALERLLAAHARLVRERLDTPGDWLTAKVGGALEGYFRKPYLLWFVAENPIRNHKLPRNIAQVTRVIIQAAQREGVDSLAEQLDYALGLVCSGCVARENGVQRELIDVLVDAGADPDGALVPALAHHEVGAAEYLLERGAELTLVAAVCLGSTDDVPRLARVASATERQMALAAAALYGEAQSLAMLIEFGVDLNAYSPQGFHAHATALHHAVDSGSLDAVKVLVEAGAALDTKDRMHQGTPLGWAEYLQRGEIAAYLRAKSCQP